MPQPSNAEVQYTEEPRQQGSLAFFRRGRVYTVDIEEGSGPWAGQHFTSRFPVVPTEIHVREDYDPSNPSNLPTYPGANNTCMNPVPALGSSESYHTVNTSCQTLQYMGEFRNDLIEHEREHEKGHNECLRSSTTRAVMKKIEKITGNKGEVQTKATDAWQDYYVNKLYPAAEYASEYPNGNAFWRYYGSTWLNAYPGIQGHSSGKKGC